MNATKTTRLSDRGAVTVAGSDAAKFLQSLITNDMEALEMAPALYTGLLSPQGKVLFDFFVVKSADGFRLDVARDQISALIKRLSMYKLRADVQISDASETLHVLAVWGGEPFCFDSMDETSTFADPRLPALGLRIITSAKFSESVAQATNGLVATEADHHAHRIGLGVPEGGKDYAFGDAFPHEALYDQLHGVSFTKGCYVGQEIVSRMEHRGTARTRIVKAQAATPLAAPGTPLLAGEVQIGTLGSSAGMQGLAMLRLDRLAEFNDRGIAITAAGTPLTLTLQDWVTYSLWQYARTAPL